MVKKAGLQKKKAKTTSPHSKVISKKKTATKAVAKKKTTPKKIVKKVTKPSLKKKVTKVAKKKVPAKKVSKTVAKKVTKPAKKVIVKARKFTKLEHAQEVKAEGLLTIGRARGYITYDEILKEFPTIEKDVAFLESLYERLGTASIDIIAGGGML